VSKADRLEDERTFMHYELSLSKDHITGNFTSEWSIWWSVSPDCSDGVYMDANTGVVEPRY